MVLIYRLMGVLTVFMATGRAEAAAEVLPAATAS